MSKVELNHTKEVQQHTTVAVSHEDLKKIHIISAIDERSVKWDSSSNKCFAEYTIRAIEGVSDTITIKGEANGFFKTSIDTRVYFIKNF